jgi:hypothetical protein
MKNFSKSMAALIRSRVFFVAVVVLFMTEAAWIAVSSRYPMAFDEEYHLGIIKLYAHQFSPLFTHQPPGPAPYGALTSDPSYLYHWLMSFPWRWFRAGFDEQTSIILMRFLNIAFFASGLVLFRKLLLKTRAGVGVVHVVLFFFVLVPVVPLLAGQVNYDNLAMPWVALNMLLAVTFREQLLQKKLNIGLLAATLSLALLGALEKFPYLPILTAIALYLLFLLWQFARPPRRKFWKVVQKSWVGMQRWKQGAAVAAVVVSTGLFINTYGLNLVKYHAIIPQCGQVLGVQPCLSYGPWARNYHYKQDKPNTAANPVVFAGSWLGGMFLRSFFAINGPGGPGTYQNFAPLPLITFAAVGTFGLGAWLVWKYRREIFLQNPVLLFLLFVSFAYLVALIAKNYYDYWQLGRISAINGRYLFPIIFPILLCIGIGYQHFLSQRREAALLLLVSVLFLQGGGALTFIHDSNENWYWPNDDFARRINHDAKKVVDPFILDWPK